jgi:selenocysteine-specific elongation factor
MVVLMDREALRPGEEGLAQLRLKKPLPALARDPFVLSLLNVQSIIGGGHVLEVTREKFRPAKAAHLIPCLTALAKREIGDFMDHRLRLERNDLIRAGDLSRSTGFTADEVEKELKTRLKKGEVLSFGTRGVFPRVRFEALKDRAMDTVETLFAEDPLKRSASPEEIRNKLAPSLEDLPFQRILSDVCGKGKLVKEGGGYRLSNPSTRVSEEQERLMEMLLDYARESNLVPISAGSFWKLHRRQYNRNELQRLLEHLRSQGRLVRLNNRRFMTPEAMDRIKSRVKRHIEKRGVLTLADCKGVLGYGRTVGVPVFEYLDAEGFTTRDGDQRTLRQDS